MVNYILLQLIDEALNLKKLYDGEVVKHILPLNFEWSSIQTFQHITKEIGLSN